MSEKPDHSLRNLALGGLAKIFLAAIWAPILTTLLIYSGTALASVVERSGKELPTLWFVVAKSVVAGLFGAVGTFVFLLLAFFIALSLFATRKGYALAGASALLAQTVLGLGLKAAFYVPTGIGLDESTNRFVDDVVTWLGLSFVLDSENWLLVAAAACVSGLIVGFMFYEITMKRGPRYTFVARIERQG